VLKWLLIGLYACSISSSNKSLSITIWWFYSSSLLNPYCTKNYMPCLNVPSIDRTDPDTEVTVSFINTKLPNKIALNLF